MIKRASITRLILGVILAVMLPTCGGGGGGAPFVPVTATIKLATVGTSSANLSGIGITLNLPAGVTPALNNDGTVAVTVVSPSGVASTGTLVAANYTPATVSTKGSLKISLISATGFGVGEFVTINLSVATGSNPTLSDFTLSGFDPIDINYTHVLTLSASLSSLVVK